MSPQIPSEMQAIHLTKFTSNISTLSPSTIPLTHDKETQLLIKVTHASPTHVDILYAQGLHQNNRTISKPPLTLGTDFAGILVCVPTEEPTNLKVGDRVYGSFFGAFAEYIAVHARLGSVRRVPKGWSLGEACAVGSAGAISLGCFLRGPPFKKGEWVLVTGASGGLGVAACQVAKALGARVIGLVGDEEKAGILRGIGVDACVDYKKVKWEQEVLRISDGGVALVYDGVGMVESGLRCCRFGGSVVIVGFAGRGGEMENLKVNRILLKGAGVLGYRFGEHGRRNPQEIAKVWEDFENMVHTGGIKPVVYKEQYRGLGSVVKALEDLHHRKVWGRAVVQISDEETTKSNI